MQHPDLGKGLQMWEMAFCLEAAEALSCSKTGYRRLSVSALLDLPSLGVDFQKILIGGGEHTIKYVL